MLVQHEFGPCYSADSQLLILGSFPSVKSRATGFYYGHPQNRFWKVLSACFKQEIPETIEAKKIFLHRQRIALWDVIDSCEITGSSDASIKNAVCTDIAGLLEKTQIKAVFLNGKTAEKLFLRAYPDFSLPVCCLPSTSPANASYSLERLIVLWQEAISSIQV